MNKYGDISPRTAVKASKRLLRVGQPLMVTQRFGQIDDQPKKSGKIRKWRRYHSFPITTAPLAEGVAPAGVALLYTDYTATLQQYGMVSELTDAIADTHEDPVLRVMMTRAGENAAEVIETITINVLKSGTNVQYAASKTSRATVTAPIARGDLRLVVRGFDRAKASTISEVVKAGPDTATQGVEPSYFAMCHTDLKPDIRGATGFISVVEYASYDKALPGEVGNVENVRFICTQKFTPWLSAGAAGVIYLAGGVAPASSLAADVYPVIIVARDAYGVVRLQGMGSVDVTVLNPNQPRGADPLGQKGSVGWKTWYACAILNHMWICRYEVACTANPT